MSIWKSGPLLFPLWPLEMSSVIDSLKQQLQEIPEINSAEVLNSVLCLKELSGQTQLEGKWIQLTNVCKILAMQLAQKPSVLPWETHASLKIWQLCYSEYLQKRQIFISKRFVS
ncbi:unnamed protein product [Rhizopus microsporus]